MPFLADAALNALLAYIADNGTRLDYTSQEATTYAEATSTYTLGNVALTAGDGNGDYTIADGDTSGRKLTVAAQSGVTATGSGDATHIALTNGTDTLIYAGPLNATLAVTSGADYDVAAFDIEARDVAAE